MARTNRCCGYTGLALTFLAAFGILLGMSARSRNWLPMVNAAMWIVFPLPGILLSMLKNDTSETDGMSLWANFGACGAGTIGTTLFALPSVLYHLDKIPCDGFVGMIVGNAVLVAGGAFFSRYLKGDDDEDGERAAFAGMA